MSAFGFGRFVTQTKAEADDTKRGLDSSCYQAKTEFINILFIILHILVLKVSGDTRVCTPGNSALSDMPVCQLVENFIFKSFISAGF